MGKRELVALLLLSSRRFLTVVVLWLFHTVPWVGLQCVIVVFSDNTNLLFIAYKFMEEQWLINLNYG